MTEKTDEPADDSRASWNDRVISQFRAGDMRIADMFDRSALLLLHTVGSRTGKSRTSPLAYLSLDGRVFVVASAGGQPSNPAWYHNLLATPRVSYERWVDDRLETDDATAVQVEGPERDDLWARITAMAPGFAQYQTKTTRTIPLIELAPA